MHIYSNMIVTVAIISISHCIIIFFLVVGIGTFWFFCCWAAKQGLLSDSKVMVQSSRRGLSKFLLIIQYGFL